MQQVVPNFPRLQHRELSHLARCILKFIHALDEQKADYNSIMRVCRTKDDQRTFRVQAYKKSTRSLLSLYPKSLQVFPAIGDLHKHNHDSVTSNIIWCRTWLVHVFRLNKVAMELSYSSRSLPCPSSMRFSLGSHVFLLEEYPTHLTR